MKNFFRKKSSREPSGYYVSRNRANYEQSCLSVWQSEWGTVTTTDEGWIRQPPADTAKKKFLIVLMGGSTAFGKIQNRAWIKDKSYPSGMYCWDISIAGQLQKMFQHMYPNRSVEVINAAIVEHLVHQHIFQYIESIRSLHPDMVVAVDGFNDMAGFITGSPYKYADGWLQDYINVEAMQRQPSFPFSLSIYRQLQMRRQYRQTDEPVPVIDDASLLKQYQQIQSSLARNTEPFLKNVDIFTRILFSDSVRVIMVLQPILGRGHNKLLTEKEQQLRLDVEQHTFSARTLKLFASRASLPQYSCDLNYLGAITQRFHYDRYVRQRMQTMVEKYNGIFIDMNDWMAQRNIEGDVFVDYCHLTPLGNKIISQAIVERYVRESP